MKNLRLYGAGRIEVFEMQRYLGIDDYNEFFDIVKKLEDDGIVKPIKSSKTNGKKPSLFNRYIITKEKKDFSCYEEELKYKLNYELDTERYQKNIERYLKDRKSILKLSDFLNRKSKLLEDSVSINERSFQIWGREKYLKENGENLLKAVNLPKERLNYYRTSEPLAYYSHHKNIPQTLLIVENKDTFYSIRKYIINEDMKILGTEIGTVIYGAGKGILRSFEDFDICVEPYLSNKNNEFLYLGDLDYEGILIYEQLHNAFKQEFMIQPFMEAYKYMVDKVYDENLELPQTKAGQNKNISDIFLNYFSYDYKMKIRSILEAGKYIPQEIMSYSDLKNGVSR